MYLDQPTMDIIAATFPYMVDASKATGGGDIPSFEYNIIDHNTDFIVEGITFTPLPGKSFCLNCPYLRRQSRATSSFQLQQKKGRKEKVEGLIAKGGKEERRKL